MFLAGGICAGLVHALRTGQGVVVDVSLLGSAAWTLGPDLAYATLAGGQLPMADPASWNPLARQYKTADGRWISLMMIDEQRYWPQASRALGLTELTEKYAERAARRQAWPQIADRIQAAIGALDHDALGARLKTEGCIFSYFATPTEVAADPAVADNGYLMRHPVHPDVRLAAAPAQFDDELPSARRPGPKLGEHSREILAELGYGPADIEVFLDENVVAQS